MHTCSCLYAAQTCSTPSPTVQGYYIRWLPDSGTLRVSDCHIMYTAVCRKKYTHNSPLPPPQLYTLPLHCYPIMQFAQHTVLLFSVVCSRFSWWSDGLDGAKQVLLYCFVLFFFKSESLCLCVCKRTKCSSVCLEEIPLKPCIATAVQ